ncbi:hypothetical protein [Haloarcula amylovorans]|uniref:hypothetical protein n=1 Tax=Haloarcula amylovorans TaxID=2562280 RepID=UPI00107672AA|nr:hypothetical protein [Halomicroarcula amylolytica]
MSDNDDVLRDRFRSHQPDSSDNTDNSHDTDGSSDSGGPDDIDDSSNADNSSESGDASVRSRKQEAMYLRPDQRKRLRNFYDELDGRSKVAGEGGLTKNDDFYEAFVEFVIEERREEFIEYLGLDEL